MYSISVNLTEIEYIEYMRFLTSKNDQFKKMYKLIRFLIPSFLVTFFILSSVFINDVVTMIIMFCVFVIASILSIFIVPKVIKKQVEKNFIKNLKEKNMLEMVIHYDFEENYIESLIKGSIGKTDYNQFDRLSETSNLFLIHLNGQTEAVVIPKRCFEDEIQVNDFKKFIERKL